MAGKLSWLEHSSDNAKVVGLISIWVNPGPGAKESSTSQRSEPRVP